MAVFDDIVASRKAWIERELQPWCRAAGQADLKKADAEWGDIAGRVDAESTLWTWAWSRFPELVHNELTGINETSEVRVLLKDGRSLTGFPDGRRSQRGTLVLLSTSAPTSGEFTTPISIDVIECVETTAGD